MKKKIYNWSILTILVWFPIIWAAFYGYVPIALASAPPYIYILTVILSIIIIVQSLKVYFLAKKRKEDFNKIIYIIIIANVLYLTLGTELFWRNYTF